MIARRGVRGLLPAVAALAVLFSGTIVGALRSTVERDAWGTALGDPRLADALRFTSWVTLAATALSSLVALALAVAVRRRPRSRTAASVPVLVPHLVAATLAVLWIGPGGMADRLLGGLPVELVRDRAGLGIILVSVWKEAPFLSLLVLTAWDRAVEDRAEAAATLGAGPRDRFRHVVWPAIRTPLAVGALVVGAFVLGSFEVPLVVGPTQPPMLATLALQQTRVGSLDGQAVASATLLIATALALGPALLAARWAGRGDA